MQNHKIRWGHKLRAAAPPGAEVSTTAKIGVALLVLLAVGLLALLVKQELAPGRSLSNSGPWSALESRMAEARQRYQFSLVIGDAAGMERALNDLRADCQRLQRRLKHEDVLPAYSTLTICQQLGFALQLR